MLSASSSPYTPDWVYLKFPWPQYSAPWAYPWHQPFWQRSYSAVCHFGCTCRWGCISTNAWPKKKNRNKIPREKLKFATPIAAIMRFFFCGEFCGQRLLINSHQLPGLGINAVLSRHVPRKIGETAIPVFISQNFINFPGKYPRIFHANHKTILSFLHRVRQSVISQHNDRQTLGTGFEQNQPLRIGFRSKHKTIGISIRIR